MIRCINSGAVRTPFAVQTLGGGPGGVGAPFSHKQYPDTQQTVQDECSHNQYRHACTQARRVFTEEVKCVDVRAIASPRGAVAPRAEHWTRVQRWYSSLRGSVALEQRQLTV